MVCTTGIIDVAQGANYAESTVIWVLSFRFTSKMLTVQGYVLGTDCRTAIPNAKIEIWLVGGITLLTMLQFKNEK